MPYRTTKTEENDFLPQSELIPKYSLPRYYKSQTEEGYYGNFFQKYPAHPNISTQHSNALDYYDVENIDPYSLPQKPPLTNQNFNENYHPQHYRSSYGNYDYYESNALLPPEFDGYENTEDIYKNQFSPSFQSAYYNPNIYDEKYVQYPVPNNYQNSDVYYRQNSAAPYVRNEPQYFENNNNIQPSSNQNIYPESFHPSYSNPQQRNLNIEREYGAAQIQYGTKNCKYRTDEISTSYRNHSPINGIDIPPKPPVRTSSLKQSNKENEGYPANCNYFKENQTSYERKLVHQNFPQSTNPKNYGHDLREKNFYSNYKSIDSGLNDKENIHRHNRNQRNTNNYDKTISSSNNQENERPAFHKYFQVNPTPVKKSSLNKYAYFLQRSTKYGNDSEKLAKPTVESSVEKTDSGSNTTAITRNDDLSTENRNDSNHSLSVDNQRNDQPFQVNSRSTVESSQIKNANYSPKLANSSTNNKFHERNSKFRNNFSESGSTDSGFSDATLNTQNGITPIKINNHDKTHISTFVDQETPPICQDLCVDSTKNGCSQDLPNFDIYSNKDYDEKVNQKVTGKNDMPKPVRRVSGDGFHTTVSGHLGLKRLSKTCGYNNYCPSTTDNKIQFDECPTSVDRRHQKSEEILQKVPENKSEQTLLKDDVEITVSGGEFLQQFEQWNDANLDQKLLKNIEEKNYHLPSKIQKHIIPYIQKGYNARCQSDETDKSAATFLIPLIDNLIKDQKTQSLPYNGPVCLIISPTREQTQKNYEEAKKFAYGTGITVSCCYGQYNAAQNLADLQNGCNILCACVGRLMTFVQNGNLSISNVQYLIIDQPEKFIESRYDSDFGILKLLNYPLFPAKDKRQTILLSATLKDPAVQEFADEHVDGKKVVSIAAQFLPGVELKK